ncbi:hypothetical protein Tco_0177000 [Tanacetum coccineum]
MIARKRVGPLPVQQHAVRHYFNHSLSDYFSLDDSARDSSSDSSSEASSDFHSDVSFDSPMTSVPALPLVDPRETSLRDDDVERGDGMDIDPVKAVIKACFDFVDIIRTSGVDVRVEAMTVARDDVETGTRDLIVGSDDGDTPPVVPKAIPVHRIQVIEGVQRESRGSRDIGLLGLSRQSLL